MDDEPMWAADHVVALTPGSAITIPKTANEFAIKEILKNEVVRLMMFPLSLTGEVTIMNKCLKPACSKKLRMAFMFVGYGNLEIDSIFALSTLIPDPENLWQRTIPSFTMKWHFSQFNTRHTQGALEAPLVIILVVQSLRVLTDFLELSILVIRLVLAWGKMKLFGFLLGLVLLPLRPIFHRGQLCPPIVLRKVLQCDRHSTHSHHGNI
ncbi:hypothetical protein Tco_0685983 [Tanacetum coccineum]